MVSLGRWVDVEFADGLSVWLGPRHYWAYFGARWIREGRWRRLVPFVWCDFGGAEDCWCDRCVEEGAA